MTHQPDHTALETALELVKTEGFEGMPNAIQILVNEAMKVERSEFLRARPHERSSHRRGYANGFKAKTVATRMGDVEFAVPQVRDVDDGERFYPSALEQGLRSERALKLAVAEMYINGVSTRKVEAITEKLCGLKVTSMEVSRATAMLDDELEAWRSRELPRCHYLILDARYERVRHGGCVVSAAVLCAIGVDREGRRSVLGVSVARSEAELHWREFLEDLRRRGLHGVELIVSDDHAGLRAALKATMTGVPWQRCHCHLQRNASARVPKQAMKAPVARALRAIFNAPNRVESERLLSHFVDEYRSTAPDLATWAAGGPPAAPAHFKQHRTPQPRDPKADPSGYDLASLLRLVTAVVIEITDDWDAGRRYLTMTEGP